MKKLSIQELNRIDIDTFKETQKFPVVLVLDNIRSMHNVGSAFRTSDAFLIEKIALCGITAQPPHREIHKTALGATESVDWTHYNTTIEAIQDLKSQGFEIVVVEQIDSSVMLHEYSFEKDKKYAFIFGNEAFGVSDDVLPHADVALEIPQFGTKHSLNISVSIGVILWAYMGKVIS